MAVGRFSRRKKRGTLKPHNSSIVLDLSTLFTTRNIQTPLTFLLKSGISNTSAQKMLNGKSVQINFRQLTSLCMAFNCAPNDLFALRKMDLPENHALQVIRDLNAAPLQSIDEWMKGKSVQEIAELLGKKEV
jgi:DNA-binding Xre family transcriptional regulator